MSSSYDSSRSRRRGVWGHWVPLVVTLTVATVGVAAWAWSQRSNEREEEESDPEPVDLDYENADYGENPPYGALGRPTRRDSNRPPNTDGDSSLRPDDVSYGIGDVHPGESGSSGGWGSQVSGALRRTSSPQQFLTNAGKTMAAGMAGVGAAVGSALAAIREDDRTAYADHETWSEEAEARKEKTSVPQAKESNKRRKTVTIVVSADTNMDDFDADGFHEHAVCTCLILNNYLVHVLANQFTVYPLSHTSKHRFFKDQTFHPNICPGPKGFHSRRINH